MPTAFVPQGKLWLLQMNFTSFYYLIAKQLPYHSKIVLCFGPELVIKKKSRISGCMLMSCATYCMLYLIRQPCFDVSYLCD